jgi:hypothetical protein
MQTADPNKPPPKFRKLRIALSLLCGLPCVLLIVLWVRSYSWFDSMNFTHHQFSSLCGSLYIDEQFKFRGVNPRSWQYHLDGDSNYVLFELGKAAAVPQGTGWKLPYWLLITFCLLLCGIPWWPWWSKRFSLRTLLITMTFISLLLGLVAYANR